MTDNFSGSVGDAQLQTKLGYWDVYWNQMSQTLTEGTPNLITTLGVGTPAVAHDLVAGSEQACILLDDNDEVYGQCGLPWWLDPDRDLHAALCLHIGEASKANIDLALAVKLVAEAEASSDAKSSPDGSITFAAVSNTLLGELQWTNKAALGIAGDITDVVTDLLQFAVTLTDKGTAAADKVGLVAVRFFGTVQFAHATGVRQGT